MMLKTFAVATAAMALALTGVAYAQAPASTAPTVAAAVPQVTHGAAPAGVCVVSVEAAIANSTVGKYVQTRLQQLGAQVNAELQAERTAIDTEAKTLDGQRATLDQTAFEQRAAAVQVKAGAFQRKAQQREQELQETQSKALNRVVVEMEPLIRQAYQTKGCGMLLNRQVVVMGLANPAVDVTPQVVTALNGKITQFNFDRERLDQAAGAARPAAPAAPRR